MTNKLHLLRTCLWSKSNLNFQCRVTPPTGSLSSSAFASNIMHSSQQQQKPVFNPPDVLPNAPQDKVGPGPGGKAAEAHNVTLGAGSGGGKGKTISNLVYTQHCFDAHWHCITTDLAHLCSVLTIGTVLTHLGTVLTHLGTVLTHLGTVLTHLGTTSTLFGLTLAHLQHCFDSHRHCFSSLLHCLNPVLTEISTVLADPVTLALL